MGFLMIMIRRYRNKFKGSGAIKSGRQRRQMMNNLRKISRIMAVIMMVLVAVTFTAPETYAAGSRTKKGKHYEVIKKGNYVYCTAYDGIYKVNIKTHAKKRLVFGNPEEYQFVSCMSLHKGYLYFTKGGAINTSLHRVKTNGKNRKSLGTIYEYVVSGSKIYYNVYNDSAEKRVKKQMKLNGRGKRSSKYKIKVKHKATNASGYYLNQVKLRTESVYDPAEDWTYTTEYMADYLMLPGGGKVLLCEYSYEM